MTLTAWQWLMAVLASYRATRLLTKDSIFEQQRDRIEQWSLDEWNRGHTLVRGKLGELITCPYCTGWWLSIVAYVASCAAWGRWAGAPLLGHAITAWAVMGAQALLNAADAWVTQTIEAANEVKENVETGDT